MDIEKIAADIVDAAITVHRALGPGLLESAYKLAFAREMELRGYKVDLEVPINYHYKGADLGKTYAMDVLINDLVPVEIKAADCFAPIHLAQTLTYLKLYDRRLGFLLNFNVVLMKEGIRRIVNNWHYQNAS
ncbi:GxxExxY protein [Flaviaesturariibacter flavus]|uniref:GxxExxY protein n=1 Tax=Flaviaesturariibacter flavus TaxID=2502780 RepID=A0A4R1B8R4_9BACT|nr:GxxExxY protein [Flaviaesturariibacter flavus]